MGMRAVSVQRSISSAFIPRRSSPKKRTSGASSGTWVCGALAEGDVPTTRQLPARPFAKFLDGSADELEMEEAAHGRPDHVGVEGIGRRPKEEGASRAGGLGGAQDRAQVAGGADAAHRHPAQSPPRVDLPERRPVVAEDGSQSRGPWRRGNAPELFRRQAGDGDAGPPREAHPFLDRGVPAEQLAVEEPLDRDAGFERMDYGAEPLDEVKAGEIAVPLQAETGDFIQEGVAIR